MMKTMFGRLNTVCPNRLSMPDARANVPRAALRSTVRRVTSCASGIEFSLFRLKKALSANHYLKSTAPPAVTIRCDSGQRVICTRPFGRTLSGTRDLLRRYMVSSMAIDDEATVTLGGNKDHAIAQSCSDNFV